VKLCAADSEVAYNCDAPSCPTLISGQPYAWATVEGLTVRACSEECLHALSAHLVATYRCSLCRQPTVIGDRVPVVNGGVQGYAHGSCQMRLQRTLGWAVAEQMKRRGMGVVGGGRS
jgi:hypothetical protein